MTPELVFSIANALAGVSWLLLVLLPRQAWVEERIAGLVVPACLAVVYAGVVGTQWAGSEGGFATLGGVAQLFTNPWMLLAGWLHYLCFDLLIGCWEVRDARRLGVSHLLLVPCLLLTFMFGPVGWLLYGAVRQQRRR